MHCPGTQLHVRSCADEVPGQTPSTAGEPGTMPCLDRHSHTRAATVLPHTKCRHTHHQRPDKTTHTSTPLNSLTRVDPWSLLQGASWLASCPHRVRDKHPHHQAPALLFPLLASQARHCFYTHALTDTLKELIDWICSVVYDLFFFFSFLSAYLHLLLYSSYPSHLALPIIRPPHATFAAHPCIQRLAGPDQPITSLSHVPTAIPDFEALYSPPKLPTPAISSRPHPRRARARCTLRLPHPDPSAQA